jgi:hypothetical protein
MQTNNDIEIVDSESNRACKSPNKNDEEHPEFIDDSLDDVSIKRLLFKFSKSGNLAKFKRYFEQLPARQRARSK